MIICYLLNGMSWSIKVTNEQVTKAVNELVSDGVDPNNIPVVKLAA
jgi:hypothetical protein